MYDDLCVDYSTVHCVHGFRDGKIWPRGASTKQEARSVPIFLHLWVFHIRLYISLAYLFVEWDEEDENGEKEHSIIDGKVAELPGGSIGFAPGHKIVCKLAQGKFSATILCASDIGECTLLTVQPNQFCLLLILH